MAGILYASLLSRRFQIQYTSHWRHKERDGVLNHQRLGVCAQPFV